MTKHDKLRCEMCNLPWATICNDGTMLVQTRHYGSRHYCSISLPELVEAFGAIGYNLEKKDGDDNGIHMVGPTH